MTECYSPSSPSIKRHHSREPRPEESRTREPRPEESRTREPRPEESRTREPRPPREWERFQQNNPPRAYHDPRTGWLITEVQVEEEQRMKFIHSPLTTRQKEYYAWKAQHDQQELLDEVVRVRKRAKQDELTRRLQHQQVQQQHQQQHQPTSASSQQPEERGNSSSSLPLDDETLKSLSLLKEWLK